MSSPQNKTLYEKCVADYGDSLYRLAYRLCGKKDLAEDLAQETFVEAWRGIGSLSDPTKARAWLFQILRFRWSHYLRDRSRRIQATGNSEVILDVGDARAGHVEQASVADHLQTALNQIDTDLKMPLLLVVMEGYTCQEAANALELPLGTVLSRIHRAKAALRELLSGQNE